MTRTEIIRQQVTAHPEMSSGELATHLNTETTQQTRRVPTPIGVFIQPWDACEVAP